MNQKNLIIKLLDAQREAHIRHCRIADHLAAHFHVNYDVFEADPLLATAESIITTVIHDRRLLNWWVTHEYDDTIYYPGRGLYGVEICCAEELWNYYFSPLKAEV